MEPWVSKLKDIFLTPITQKARSLEKVYAAAALAEEGLWEHARVMVEPSADAGRKRNTLRNFIKEVGLDGVPVMYGVGRI